MSLGDWEHSYLVTLQVRMRSKFEDHKDVDHRLDDPSLFIGHDGVEVETDRVQWLETEDLLPPGVRDKITREEYRSKGLCEQCGENPCHVYCSLQTYRAGPVVPQINPVYPSAEVLRAFGVCSNCGTQLIGSWCHGCGKEWNEKPEE